MGKIIGNKKVTEKLYTLVEITEITSELNAKIVELTEAKEEEMSNGNATSAASENNYKVIFKSTVFMGDSLTEAIYAYGFLDSTSVVAEKGKNVMTALEDDVPKVVNLVPNRVIMLYGMNDLECFEDLNDFCDKYKILINSTKEKLP